MQRTLFVLILALGLAVPLTASAQSSSNSLNLGTIRKDRHIGVGVGTGTLASGFSLKYLMSDTLSVQANLGGCHRCVWGGNINWNWGTYGGFAVSADVLLEMPAFLQNELVRLGWNLGAGAGLGVSNFSSTLAVAPAFVAGFTMEFQPIPIDLVLEWRPNLRVFIGNTSGIYADIIYFTAHLRFYIL